MTQQPFSDPNFQQTRDSYRHRQLLLNKVKNYWIRGVLEKSLHGRTLIELGLEERLDAIEFPLGVAWQTPDEPRQILPPGMGAIAFFDAIGDGRTLIILGEPGSGKTTILLQIARELIERAIADIHHPIPVVFNLSSWVNQEQSICTWLIEELHTQYQITKQIGQAWVNQGQLLLMLDGLDEVSEQHRVSCVQALNKFNLEFGAEIVVCSRILDYEALSDRLKFQRAIYLQPLAIAQIHRYLADLGEEMAAVRTIIQQDATLQELVTTPLMLSIITFAYKGMSPEELPSTHSIEEGRKHLFNTYIQRMFSRRKTTRSPSQAQLIRALSEMAYRMSQQSQTVLLIERLQPSWLQINFKNGSILPFLEINKQKTKAYRLYALGVRLIISLIWGAIAGAFSNMLTGELSGSLTFGLIAGVMGGLSTKIQPIEPIDSLKWSWYTSRNAIIFGSCFALSSLLSGVFAWGLVVGMTGVLITGLSSSVVETTTIPNQGIWQSIKNALIFTLMGVGLCLIGGAGIAGSPTMSDIISISIFTGGLGSLILGLNKGGKAGIQHFILRLVLYCNGSIPWNYARFLDGAVDRTFLQKIGGGYIFIHRLLQEHFAALGVENYLQTIAISSNNAEDYLKRGNARFSLCDYQGAIDDYTQAIHIKPDFAEAYAGRSRARYMLGDYQSVVEDYDWTVQINPSLAKAITYTSQNSNYLRLEAKLEIVEEPKLSYSAILMDDNFNTFEYVSQCLRKYIPGMTSDRAWQLAHQVHNEGLAIVWSGRQELAALYRMQLSNAGLTMAFLETTESIKK